MSATIPNLWPDDITVDVVTPAAILKAQASQLAASTKGLLLAEVNASRAGSQVVHQLDVIAPALGGYRHRLLQVSHRQDRVYPATVSGPGLEALSEWGDKEAYTQQELLKLIGASLQSGEAKSLLLSLIARSNEPKTGEDNPDADDGAATQGDPT